MSIDSEGKKLMRHIDALIQDYKEGKVSFQKAFSTIQLIALDADRCYNEMIAIAKENGDFYQAMRRY